MINEQRYKVRHKIWLCNMWYNLYTEFIIGLENISQDTKDRGKC